jgi:SAM-dependent methyltransferase
MFAREDRVMDAKPGSHILYAELAPWWPLLSPPADYQEEATYYADTFDQHGHPPRRTLLELGSGGGNNASWLKRRFEHVTLVDSAPGMLEVSRALNPECAHHIGDMRTVRLGRVFDCVFVHDAICYMTSVDDLRAVFETARVHCRAGGVALFAPDFVRETFQASTDHGGHDGDDRALRCLEWTWDPDPDDTTYLTDYAYALREADGHVRVRQERHTEGLFPMADWMRLLNQAGFDAQSSRHQHPDVSFESVVFVGVAR